VGRPRTGPGRRYRAGRRDHDIGLAALGSTSQPVAIDRARIDRQIRELALEQAGLLGDDTDRTRLRALRDQRDAIVERTAPGLPGQRAVEWL
jgi:hypothetical protein